VFYQGDQFPAAYKGGLFVALKGSWNRSVPTGYKIVWVPFKDGRPEGYYENFAVGFWASGEQRAQVEECSAGENRGLAAPLDIVDGFARTPGVIGCVELFVRVSDVEQMMRNGFAVGARWLCGSDVEAAIDLHRVVIDDLAAGFTRKAQCEIRLAAARRPSDDYELHRMRVLCVLRSSRSSIPRRCGRQ